MFFEIGVLKNFAIFKEKHMCSSLFLITLQANNFPVNITKFLRYLLLKNVYISQENISDRGVIDLFF